MGYTPVEIRHVRLGKGLLGYKRAPVDELLGEIAQSFEDVWRDRADLADSVEQLEADLARLREQETLLTSALVSAERAAHEAREEAKRQADLIIAEAQAEARQITRMATNDRESLLVEAKRVRTLLRSALEIVEEADRAPVGEEKQSWPRREDTREFPAPDRHVA